MFYKKIKSPIGELHLISDGSYLTDIVFKNLWSEDKKKNMSIYKCKVLEEAAQQLKEYFSKKRKTFELPVRLEGTEFQQKVWRSLESIPYGQTISYSEQARRIRNPKAVRCVGTTNGKNPIPIIIPCHRVIGKDGSLTGFGGGLAAKKYLLELEGYKLESRKK